MRIKKLLLFFAAAFLFTTTSGQEKKPATITGVVKDARTKSPLIEAVITLSSNSFEGQKFALTDSTGMYRIKNLTPGNYAIAFEMEGYEKFTHDSIALKEGASLGVSFEMIKERKRNNRPMKVSNVTAND